MKRYRVIAWDFDTRATLLQQKIEKKWSLEVKQQWEANKRKIKEGLIAEFGCIHYNRKIEDFIDLGSAPISIIAFHNKFYHQARNAFVIGAYYPCLTAACALGERILNQLVIHLRDDFKDTNEYKKVYKKKSFDNWDFAIDILNSWKVLLPKVTDNFRKLRDIRHRTIHFNPETDHNNRQLALDAMRDLSNIIDGQFSGFGLQPWYIPGIKGASFIMKSAEAIPFVKRIILPNCHLVGYLHTLEKTSRGWLVQDNHEYKGHDISDEEYKELFNNREI